jgi:hypothetical protein
MNNLNIRQYLVTAATVFSVEEWLKKWLKEGYLDALLAKQAEECLPHYFCKYSINQTTYPEVFVDLVRSWSFSNLSRFRFVPTLKRGEGDYRSETSHIIILSSCRLSELGGDLDALVHEVTHALKPTPDIQPQGSSYLEFMRDWLCEEIVAESSCYYGYDGSKKILNDFFRAPFLDYHMILEGINKDDRETLTESVAYALLSKCCFETEGWIRQYTKYYNQANNTNHSVSQTFDPPLLPPTLARAVKDILEKNPSIKDMWHKETGITPKTLALAAEQTQWPMFESDILNQQSRERLEKFRNEGR